MCFKLRDDRRDNNRVDARLTGRLLKGTDIIILERGHIFRYVRIINKVTGDDWSIWSCERCSWPPFSQDYWRPCRGPKEAKL